MNLVYWLTQRVFRYTARGFFDFTVLGADNARNLNGPALIASNHVSYLDPPLVGAALDEDCYFLARKSLASNTVITWLFKHWQIILLDRDKPDPSTLKTIFQRLEEGKKVIVFPEGTRSIDGAPLKGEPGVGMMVARAKVPVLPVRIFGAHEALPRDRKCPHFTRITISIGKPWYCDPSSYGVKGKETYQLIANDVMQRISELPER
jgi:1-acyl-sn-glycerol-3-phosphate acyltransferase